MRQRNLTKRTLNIILSLLKMESQLQESFSFPAQEFAKTFFSTLPTDQRFLQVTHQKFLPNSSLESSTIEFLLGL